ncbi:methylase involved in ubiquinone/menaquinone biosynthesis [Idiomarina sp. A28L]|uniref:class I SAM-dependent methyltransferase n=1 Tax=Idiomarina sp. A28L TaxID=1036674 RepID=UPI0002138B56|nr:methyltransferase domain-containing protein [Idiomarina sp. A28L]EGN74318.1 methylase involved in ubiquinone/menaquinone biosynthesis [Idiomarina sp. A28L]
MWLKPATSDYSQPLLENWQQMRHGEWLCSTLEKALEPHWETIFGHYLLKLGGLSASLPNNCRIREQYAVGLEKSAQVRAELNALPFFENTVDAALLVHVLEYHPDPHAVLREVNRVMRADGHLVLALSNPFSPGQLIRAVPGAGDYAPWNSRMFSPQRVRDWLSLMHFEEVAFGYYGVGVPLAKHRDPEQGWGWLLEHCPWLQAGYYLVARKREWPLTPVRLTERRQQRSMRPESVAAGRYSKSEQ